MRRQKNIGLAAIANLAHEPDHSLTSRRIEAVGGFIEKDQARPVNYRLGQFGKLFHSQRISFETTVASFSQTYIKKGLVSALKRGFGRQTRQLGHQSHKTDGAHLRDKRIAFR